ncbi:MAG: hypothetical protein WC955_13365, partial [Elusimicrobiota bacterium]
TLAVFGNNLVNPQFVQIGLNSASTYYYKVQAFNENGVATSYDVMVATITLDGVEPTVGIMSPVNGSNKNSVTLIYGTAADNVMVSTVSLRIHDITVNKNWTGTQWLVDDAWRFAGIYPSSWTYPSGSDSVPAWLDGNTYSVEAQAVDSAGNLSVSYSTINFLYDVSLPTSVVTYPVHGAVIGALTTISGTATDSLTNITKVELSVYNHTNNKYWDGAAFNNTEIKWSTATIYNVVDATSYWRYTDITSEDLTTHTTYWIASRAYDNTGNIELSTVWSSTVTFEDLTAPSAVTDLVGTPVYERGAKLVWTAPGDDENQGDLNGKYRIDYNTNSGYGWTYNTYKTEITTSVAQGTICKVILTDIPTDATYYFQIWSQDDSGNWAELSSQATVYVTNIYTHVWDGSGATNNAAEAANWLYDVAPSTGDSVIFNSDSNTKYCRWDLVVTLSSFTMDVGFSTAVVLNSSLTVVNDFVISGGTLTYLGGHNLYIGSDWVQTGGYFEFWRSGGSNVTCFNGTTPQTITMLNNSMFGDVWITQGATVTANSNLIMGSVSKYDNLDGRLNLGNGYCHSIFNHNSQQTGGEISSTGILDIGNSTLTITCAGDWFNVNGTILMTNGDGRIELKSSALLGCGGKFYADSPQDVITSTAPGELLGTFATDGVNDGGINVTGLTMKSVVLEFDNSYSSNVAVSNVQFVNFPPNNYGIWLDGGTSYPGTMRGVYSFNNFYFDNSVTTNVYVDSALSVHLATITFTNSSGAKASPQYEVDPNNVVFWSTPPAVSNLYAVTRGTGSVEWNWTDVSKDEKYYRLRKNTDELVTELPWNTTYYTEASLSANTTYYRKVEAYNVLGTSVTNTISGVTYARPPVNTYVSARTSYSVTIDWSPNDNPGYTRWGVIGSTDGFVTSTTTLAVFGNNLVNPQFVQIG